MGPQAGRERIYGFFVPCGCSRALCTGFRINSYNARLQERARSSGANTASRGDHSTPHTREKMSTSRRAAQNTPAGAIRRRCTGARCSLLLLCLLQHIVQRANARMDSVLHAQGGGKKDGAQRRVSHVRSTVPGASARVAGRPGRTKKKNRGRPGHAGASRTSALSFIKSRCR